MISLMCMSECTFYIYRIIEIVAQSTHMPYTAISQAFHMQILPCYCTVYVQLLSSSVNTIASFPGHMENSFRVPGNESSYTTDQTSILIDNTP